jgi:putative spermidine/putrescine transport system substrate-binding protein
MKRALKFTALMLLSTLAIGGQASAQEKLVVSTWGGSFRDLIDEAIAEQLQDAN